MAALGQTRGAMALVVTLFFIMEAVVLVVGLSLGLARPADGALFLSSFWLGMLLWNAFHLHFIPNGGSSVTIPTDSKVQDFVVLVIVLILLICLLLGWVISGKLDRNSGELADLGRYTSDALIACWTTLPQMLPLTRHGNKRKSFTGYCSDSVLVLDENGKIRQTNTAAEELFQMNRI